MKIATWNVNSLNVRFDQVIKFLGDEFIDILLLQEIKMNEDKFPYDELNKIGFNSICHGQKSYNGVAIISKHKIYKSNFNIYDENNQIYNDDQARFIEAEINGLKVCSIYVPNGNPYPSEKYDYKITWLKKFVEYATKMYKKEIPYLIGGDFNIIPNEVDCYNIKEWENDALWKLEVRSLFYKLINVGYKDLYRSFNYDKNEYTFWDYQRGSWEKNNGIRIDHFLLTPELLDRVDKVYVEKKTRGWNRPSDHVPLVFECN